MGSINLEVLVHCVMYATRNLHCNTVSVTKVSVEAYQLRAKIVHYM